MPKLMPPPVLEPMRELNMTPLIDVLLVLLVMFLLALPVMTHKVSLDLPQPGQQEEVVPLTHLLAIGPTGALRWDGRPLPRTALVDRLEQMAGDPALPHLEIAASSEARYEEVDEILAEISRAGVTRIGFIGNSAFAESF